mmetsp:Transcript_12371/g.25177  ORF Transcript_12371/g.25177 Transcript_12371/m.25177 type:complete len:709 (+) Transcript_12371:177-2303(+)
MGKVLSRMATKLHPSVANFTGFELKDVKKIEKLLAKTIRRKDGMANLETWTTLTGSPNGFELFDKLGVGLVSSMELLVAISLCCRASLKAKAKQLFDVFDVRDQKVLDEQTLVTMISLSINILATLTNTKLELPPTFIPTASRMAFRAVSDSKKGISLPAFLKFVQRNKSAASILGKFGTTDMNTVIKRREERLSAMPRSLCQHNMSAIIMRTTTQDLIDAVVTAPLTKKTGGMDFGAKSTLKLTPTEVIGIKTVFDVLDDDHSGYLTIQELEESFSKNKRLGSSTSPIFHNLDESKDGQVDFLELLKCIYPNVKHSELVGWSQYLKHEKLQVEDVKTMHVLWNKRANEYLIEVHVAFGDMRRRLTVDTRETVAELKERLEQLMNFIPDIPAVLVFEDKPLSNKKTIGSYGIYEECTVEYTIPEEPEDMKRDYLSAKSALVCAVRADDVSKVKAFMKNDRIRRRRVRAMTKKGKTMLHIATSNASINVMRTLIDMNADVNDCDNNGNSPLHVACQKQNEQCIDILLRAGAMKEILNSNSDVPFELLDNPKLKRKYLNITPGQNVETVNGVGGAPGKRVKPLLPTKYLAQSGVSIKETLAELKKNPTLSKYTQQLGVQRLNKRKNGDATTPVGFYEFLAFTFKDTHSYREMHKILEEATMKLRLLNKEQLNSIYKDLSVADGTDNFYKAREYLRSTLHIQPSDINIILE